MYALIKDNAVARYPYTVADLRADNPDVSFPEDPDAETLAAFGVVDVAPSEPPKFDAITQTLIETQPTFDGKAWAQAWTVSDATPEAIAARQREVRSGIVYATQKRLDDFAATRGYGDARTSPIVAACSYASSSHPRYGVEGRYCLQMREETWDVLFAIEADVAAGKRPMPSGYPEIEPELPALAWPA